MNLPELEEDKIELQNRVAEFHAILLVEKIKQLNISDVNKKKVLKEILKNLKEKADHEKSMTK